jgi:microcystin-dependent protein
MEIKINGKALIGILALSVGIASANFVSLVDSDSAGGISIIEEQSPIGSVIMWAGSTPPEGWLEMNGQSTAGYTKLAEVVGATLPDLRGEFVRGWDNGKGIDSGRVILSNQSEAVNAAGLTFKGDALPPHSHKIYGGYQGGYSNTYANADAAGGSHSYKPSTYGASAGTPSGTIQGSGTETRPRNVALMYIIKAE